MRGNFLFACLRVIFASISGGLAAAIPHLHDIVALVGASSASLLAFACPTIFHWITFSSETTRLTAAKNIFIITFSVIGSVTGTYASLKNMIENK